MRAFRRQYRSNFAAVPKARRDVTAFARTCGLLPSDVSDIALAVGEACNNAAEHGHVASGSFEVSCAYENGELTVEVTDRGSGFDPHGKGDCKDPENLGLRGLGIFIMRSLMDDICFTTRASGTSVRLTKYGLHEQAGNGVSRGAGYVAPRTGLGAVHERLKALLKLARVQPGQRRQR